MYKTKTGDKVTDNGRASEKMFTTITSLNVLKVVPQKTTAALTASFYNFTLSYKSNTQSHTTRTVYAAVVPMTTRK